MLFSQRVVIMRVRWNNIWRVKKVHIQYVRYVDDVDTPPSSSKIGCRKPEHKSNKDTLRFHLQSEANFKAVNKEYVFVLKAFMPETLRGKKLATETLKVRHVSRYSNKKKGQTCLFWPVVIIRRRILAPRKLQQTEGISTLSNGLVYQFGNDHQKVK